jgi:hypothetical protein
VKAILKSYLKSLAGVVQQGDAREESFYSTLANMLQQYAGATGNDQVHITTLPRKTRAGNPDFRVWNGKDRIIGYIEAKKPSETNLDQIEHSEQLERYRRTFPNLILTNFIEFRLYRDGQMVDRVQIAPPIAIQLGQTPTVENADHLLSLLERFIAFSLPRSFTAESLAIELAKRTRFLRDVVLDELLEEQAADRGDLLGFYEAFQRFLIANLTLEAFADLYAQTVTYGLFAARTRATNGFTRKMAYDYIPRTIGILRDVFRFISTGDLPKQVEWMVDDLAEVLSLADATGILDRYYREGKGSDPIVHFYETFLAEYDPEERERRGVYYTPEPVVDYIVRSLHHLLVTRFNRPDGLAARGVTLLDPAAGTMTFVARAVQLAVQEFERKYGAGGREVFIGEHILKNFYAFELMMAPYAVGHLKMSFYLEELGHRLSENERFQFYLTNTLETAKLEQTNLPGMASLADESRLAEEVKKKRPILVILGNPPYSGHSSNRGDWILSLINDYKQVDGKPLGEKNPKWLQDDYVKFLRFAQWKIDQAGQGVVGMITNHSYLDNPTFRGMRNSLMRTFDEIFVLDLHGNSLKRETTPEGGKDENVFDIRQGVAIAFFVKHLPEKQGLAVVQHSECWGLRDEKYAWLAENDLDTTEWQPLQPKAEFYLFLPRDEASLEQYNSFIKVTDLFPVHSVGIVTARDKLTIHWTPEEAWQTAVTFANMEPELARQAYDLGKDARDWRVTWAQKDLKTSGLERGKIVPILYRPFDVRYTYYTGNSRGFHCMPRDDVMRNFISQNNIALISPRQNKNEFGVYTTIHIGTHKTVAVYDINYYFPLYLYPHNSQKDLFSLLEPQVTKPNLNPVVLDSLEIAYRQKPTPEEIFYYVYAVLHADFYRQKYAEFLKIDFPRIPFTASHPLFQTLAALGERLAGLHLLKSPELEPPQARFDGQGDNRVATSKSQGFVYDPKEERVYINKTQYFAPVPLELWEYQIGGYQVLEKWLKDRRGRRLSLDEIKTYCQVVTAIRRTIEVQEEIDALYPQVEEEVVGM